MCSRPAAGPTSSARRASTFMWMSSYWSRNGKVPAAISASMASSPPAMAAWSALESTPALCNIAACAREPSRSWRASRLSKPIETLIACIRASGFSEKRPPHISWPPAPSAARPAPSEGSSAMSNPPQPSKPAPRGRLPAPLRLAVWTTAALGGAAVLYISAGALATPGYHQARGPAGVSGGFGQAQAATPSAAGPLHVIPPLTASAKAAPAPDASFTDAAGKPVRVGDFKGRVVVLNLWATWCGPCIKEMPTLAALAASEAKAPVKVVALSVDRAAAGPRARAFIAKNAPLAFYQDASFSFPSALKPPVMGFPTTLIFDKRGRLRATVSSDIDWNGAPARRVIGKLAAEPA